MVNGDGGGGPCKGKRTFSTLSTRRARARARGIAIQMMQLNSGNLSRTCAPALVHTHKKTEMLFLGCVRTRRSWNLGGWGEVMRKIVEY